MICKVGDIAFHVERNRIVADFQRARCKFCVKITLSMFCLCPKLCTVGIRPFGEMLKMVKCFLTLWIPFQISIKMKL